MNKNILRRSVQTISFLVLAGIMLFATAGTILWNEAWAFLSTGLLILTINMVVLPREVIEERGRKKVNVKKWDLILTRIAGIPYFSLFPLCGLDHRLGWSPGFQDSVVYTSLAVYFLASMGFTWAMVSNRFFSTMVRIQQERGHAVATRGPYRYMRHPGYLAFILMVFAIPLVLGSSYGLILSGLVAVLFITRTALEDRTLMKELEGYPAYALEVKYRLIPFIW